MAAASDLIERLEAETGQYIDVAKCEYCVRVAQVNDAGLCSVCAEQMERATIEA